MLKRATISIKYTKTQIRKLEEIFKKYLGIDLNKLIEEEIQNIEDYNILYKSLNVKVSIPKESIAIANILSKYKNELIKKDKKLEKTLNKLFTIDNLEQKIIEEINKKRPKEELENKLKYTIENYIREIEEIDRMSFLISFSEILNKYKNKSLEKIYKEINKKIENGKKLTKQEIYFHNNIYNAIKLLISFLDEFEEDFKEYYSTEVKEIMALRIIDLKFESLINHYLYKRRFSPKVNSPSFLKKYWKEPLYPVIDEKEYLMYLYNSKKSRKEIDKELKEISESNNSKRKEFFKHLEKIAKEIDEKIKNWLKKHKEYFADIKYTNGILTNIAVSYEPEDYYAEAGSKIIEVPEIKYKDGIIEYAIRINDSIPKVWEVTAYESDLHFSLSNIFNLLTFKKNLNNNKELESLYKEKEKLKKAIQNYDKITKFSKKIINDLKTIYKNKENYNKAIEFNFN